MQVDDDKRDTSLTFCREVLPDYVSRMIPENRAIMTSIYHYSNKSTMQDPMTREWLYVKSQQMVKCKYNYSS